MAVEMACHVRKFFTTKKGYFGVRPTCMKKNDLVCVLYGGRVPFLRPKNDFCHLVGECYVRGIMDGEAIMILEAGQLSEASFEVH